MSIQLRGRLSIATDTTTTGPTWTDVKDYVSQFQIDTQRESISVPGTLGLNAETVAGDRSDTLTLTFHSAARASAFWSLLYTIVSKAGSATERAASCQFKGNLYDETTSTDNLLWKGHATLLSLATGGTVGQLRQQTITLPIRAGTLTSATTGS